MVVREAANARTASIVVKDSAPSECIKDGFNGLLCLDDSNSLYEKLKEPLLNEDYAIKLGINAKETIPVSWDSVMDEALARYQIVIDNYK